MRKKIISIAAAVLLLFCAIGGTIAWLIDRSEPVINTFTAGDININLEEKTGDAYKMVPGTTIKKDPKVTVKAGSEACWLFVKVEESNNFADFITYDLAEGWKFLDDSPGVYYREVGASAADQPFSVLKDDQVTVNTDVTKTALNALDTTTYPKLIFTAYAIQRAQFADVNSAWTEAQKLDPTNS